MAHPPTYVGTGTTGKGDGAVTVGVPSGYAENDVLLLLAETDDADTFDPTSVLSDWTAVTSSPVTGDGVKLWAYWKRAGVAESDVTLADAGDHQIAKMFAIRGCPYTGDPWDGTPQASTESTVDTSGSATGYTTSAADTLVLVAAGASTPDSNSPSQFSDWTNAALESLTERADTATNGGSGGSLGVATGIKVTAGAIGATTYTRSTAAAKAHLVIAFREVTTHTQATSASTVTARYTSESTVA